MTKNVAGLEPAPKTEAKNKPPHKRPLEVKRVKRFQKRRKSRRVEAGEQDWAAWDAAAAHLGLTWSEFCRRAMNQLKTQAVKLVGAALAAVAVIGCSASPQDALECVSAGVVDTEAGPRLLVSCNRDVERFPAYCEAVGGSQYRCNILHTTPDDCAAFPGLCR